MHKKWHDRPYDRGRDEFERGEWIQSFPRRWTGVLTSFLVYSIRAHLRYGEKRRWVNQALLVRQGFPYCIEVALSFLPIGYVNCEACAKQ